MVKPHSVSLFFAFYLNLLLDAVYGNGIENLTHEQKRMAPYLVEWLCLMGDEKCLEINKSYFDKVRQGQLTWREINVNLRDFVSNYGIRASQELRRQRHYLYMCIQFVIYT